MRAKKLLSVLTALAMLPSVGAIAAAAADNTTTVRLNPADASPFNDGRFQGWGTALCWWANRLGYSEKLTEQSAKAFFSDEGLGLDIARYNLGGGDDPTHNHINRSDSKVPGVYSDFKLSDDGKNVESITYDITKDQNQLNIAKAALAANPNLYFEGFSNSAPYFMTITGCTGGGNPADSDNLNPDMYDDFGKFIADATKLFKDEGIVFQSYSPMNEPDTNYWGVNSPKQEGCHFNPGNSQSKAIIETRKALDAAGLNDVLVAGMDETSLKKTANNLGSLSDEAKAALGRVDTHTYSDRNYHAQVKAKAIEMNKTLWQSEVDAGGDGFRLADMILEDMNGMQPAAWVMWDIVDFHKDSNFVDPTTGNKTEANNSLAYTGSVWGVGMADHDSEELFLTNKYYAYGQFSRYIEPGDTIIASSAKTLAAYNKDSGAIKIVAPNSGSQDLSYSFDLSGFKNVGSKVTTIRTDRNGNEKWAAIENGAQIDGKMLTTTLKAGTITTYVIENNETAVTKFVSDSNGLEYAYSTSTTDTDKDCYFAVYDSKGMLKSVTKNQPKGTLDGDFTDCSYKLMVWDNMTPGSDAKTTVTDTGKAEYAIIDAPDQIPRGSSVQLKLNTDMEGEVSDWKVSDTSIAAITDDGTLTAEKPGKVKVTVNVGDYAAEKEIEITVYAAINGAASNMKAGQSVQLTADTNALGDVSWSIDNTDAASISEDGMLTLKNAGNVTVTLTVGDLKVTKTIRVILYELSGTPSWGNSSTPPADSADYTMAADGDLNTFFDGTQNGWVRYDYGSPYKITSVKLAARSGHDGRTAGAKIQASNDGITWTDLYTISSAISSGTYTTISASQLANNNAYRYFRYTNPTEMTNIAEFIIEAQPSDEIAAGEPHVTDIAAFTDNFEMESNIFGAAPGDLTADGNQVYTTKLARFGNVFVPVKAAATAETNTIALKSNEKFRLTYDMFSGWESSGRDNTMSIKDDNGNELVGYTITGGGYNLNQLRIGGIDVLADVSDKPVIQCKSNATKGANGWDHASQPYANNMGLNRSAEIIIDGTGAVNVSFTGGSGDLSYSGTISTPISIKSLELAGSYNTARGRVVSYDNFDGDVITYSEELATPAPTPKPTDAPVIPENGELINMNFDNGDLTSTSSYGKAEGSPKFAEVDGKKCIQFDGTAATVINLKDANGNALLTGQDEITISFKVKPTSSGTSWWFFAAPNASAQTYQQEQYLGALTNGGTMTVERYKNNGSRLPVVTGTYTANEWNDVTIAAAKDVTTLYINGVMTEQTSSAALSDLLGKSSVAYIGLANWGSGEYATGYIDDFVITKGVYAPVINMPDLSAVVSDIAMPAAANDGTPITWTSSNTDVITNDGKVIRPAVSSEKVVLTAELIHGKTYTLSYTANVIGLAAVIDTFTAYAENNTIYYTSDESDTPYAVSVTIVSTDDDSNLKTIDQQDGQFSGSFGPLANGTYKITCQVSNNTDKVASVSRTIKVKNEQEMSAYLFAHFMNTEGDATCEQIYFSVSQDGTNWTTLNDKKPILTSNVGENGVRDPYIIRGEDGKFFIIATDLSIYERRGDSNRWGTCQTSGSQSIVIWESDDLVNWSEARLVKVAKDNAGCTWAPEAVYDTEKDAYMVFWASKTADDNYATQRMYRSYTKDFVTFTEPEIYIDGGNISNIDTTITSYKGIYYRFTKNESNSSVNMMKSTSLDGPWTDVETYSLGTMTGYEGPTIYKLNGEDKWCLLLDYYSRSQGYKPFVTDDITKGEFTSAGSFTFDGNYRHGTVIPITAEEYKALTEKY